MKSHLVSTSKWALAIIVVSTTVLLLGPKFESYLLPPFSQVTYSIVDVTDSHVDILVTGIKVRDCSIKSAVGLSKISGEIIQSQVMMLNLDGTRLDKEQQRISVGAPFVRIVRVTPGSPGVEILIETTCHPFWSVKQAISKYPTD